MDLVSSISCWIRFFFPLFRALYQLIICVQLYNITESIFIMMLSKYHPKFKSSIDSNILRIESRPNKRLIFFNDKSYSLMKPMFKIIFKKKEYQINTISHFNLLIINLNSKNSVLPSSIRYMVDPI